MRSSSVNAKIKKLAVFMILFMGVLVSVSGVFHPCSAHAGDPECKYTQKSYNHVYPRHCDPNEYPEKSKFLLGGNYCANLPGGQFFCELIQDHDSVQRTEQPDGRIRYDADLGVIIGTRGEKWGRVVIDKQSGEVVTQFPEFDPNPKKK